MRRRRRRISRVWQPLHRLCQQRPVFLADRRIRRQGGLRRRDFFGCCFSSAHRVGLLVWVCWQAARRAAFFFIARVGFKLI